MSWIKLETHTFDKLEIYSIAQELGIDPDSVLGKCCRVWAWFDANTTDGVTKSVTRALLDRYCGVTGFCKAMINAGWMSDDGELIQLPFYDRHNSATAKARALGGKRQAKFKSNALGNAEVTQEVTENEEKSLPESSHREEKRREEKKEESTSVAGPLSSEKEKPKKSPSISLKTYIAECKERDVKAIPEDSPVFDYIEEIELPQEYLRLQWAFFKDRYSEADSKRYTFRGWPVVFKKSVAGNWFKLWYADTASGGYKLTTQGIQAQKAFEAKNGSR